MPTTITTKVGHKFQIVIPKKLREAARIEVGDLLTAEVKPEGILLKPAVVVERGFKAELEQHLREAEADVKAGRTLGPFDNAHDAMRAMKAFAKKRKHARIDSQEVRRTTR